MRDPGNEVGQRPVLNVFKLLRGPIKSTESWKKKLNLERLTVRLELTLTVVYSPVFRQARPDFSRECMCLLHVMYTPASTCP